ncbi:MAG: NADH-quinone oxidoreductase subunit N [Flavobacteriales bacterium]|jgi:NADH-quinone oxidoreductase subunit N|nr:NADH-quinone oxidoreductase subunit N [Flavobacteriales bacterium]
MSALILTSVLGVLLLYLGVFGHKRLLAPVAVLGLLGAIGVSATGWWMDVPLFSHMVRFDSAAAAFNMAMTGLTILLFLFGVDYYARMERDVAEHYALMVFSLTGAFLLTSYTNLLVLFLGIEVLSIPLYILAGGKKSSYRSGEASFKYFLLGSFATALFLMGIALVYGVTASFDLGRIQEVAVAQGAAPTPLFLLGLFFITIGLSFKVAAVPFHFWSPDVYEGAPTLVTAFMATVVKMAAFAGFLRLVQFTALPPTLATALLVMTVLTLFIGNIVALRQTNFKRLMAYSSVAHTGFLLLVVLGHTAASTSTLFYYTFTYGLATVGLFVVMTLVKRAANGSEEVRSFRGLYQARPWLAITALLLLLSLAGIPLTAGFVAKYQVFLLALQAGFLKTTVLAVAMALVGIAFYIVVVREAFTADEQPLEVQVTPLNGLVVLLCGIAVVALGVWPIQLP